MRRFQQLRLTFSRILQSCAIATNLIIRRDAFIQYISLRQDVSYAVAIIAFQNPKVVNEAGN
jgi:hypothetical protein